MTISTDEHVRSLMYELLNPILSQCFNFGVAHRVVQLFGNATPEPSFLDFVEHAIATGTADTGRLRTIPLETGGPVIECGPIQWERMRSHFTIDMVVTFDEYAAVRVPAKVTILKLTDGSQTFDFWFQAGVVSVTYTTGSGESQSGHLFRNVAAGSFIRLTTIYMRSSGTSCRFFSYVNGDRLTELPLNCSFDFDPKLVKGVIGGSDNLSKDHLRYFILKDFRIYPLPATEQEFDHLLVNSDGMISRAMVASEMPTTFTELPAFHEIPILLDLLCKGDLATTLSQVSSGEMLSVTCTVLSYIFRRSSFAQSRYSGVAHLDQRLSQSPHILTFNLYYSFYLVLPSIQEKRLFLDWFERLVLNLWIWIQAPEVDFLRIITHWKKTLLSKYSDVFREKSYFSRLLTQFHLAFCLEPETEIGYFVSPASNHLRSACREEFLHFIINVSKMNFNEDDFDTLFSFATQLENPVHSGYFITLLHHVSRRQVTTTRMTVEHYAILHRLFGVGDHDLISLLFFALHNLSGSSVLSQMTTSACEILGHPSLNTIFDFLSSKLSEYPCLFAALAIMAGHLGEKFPEKLAQAALQLAQTKVALFVAESNWLLFPLLLLYNLPIDMVDPYCRFLSQCLILSRGPMDVHRAIAFMLRMTTIRNQYSPAKVLVKFLGDCVREMSQSLISTIVEQCFTLFFMHLSIEPHNPALMKAFEVSVFASELPESKAEPLPEPRLFPLNRLEALVKDSDFLNFRVFCQIRLDDEGELLDKVISRLAIKLLPSVSDERIDDYSMEMIFNYFANRSSLTPNQRFHFSEKFTRTLDHKSTVTIHLK
jgi:hypothetical protein